MENGTLLVDSAPLSNGQADAMREISQNGGAPDESAPVANGGGTVENVEEKLSGRRAKEAERRRRRRTKKKKSGKKEPAAAGKEDQSDSDKENADEVIVFVFVSWCAESVRFADVNVCVDAEGVLMEGDSGRFVYLFRVSLVCRSGIELRSTWRLFVA